MAEITEGITPGKWRFDKDDTGVGYDYILANAPSDAGDIRDTVTIAEVMNPVYARNKIFEKYDEGKHGSADANGKLIAAAPELLAACEAAADAMSDMLVMYDDGMKENGASQYMRKVLADVQAAVREAGVSIMEKNYE